MYTVTVETKLKLTLGGILVAGIGGGVYFRHCVKLLDGELNQAAGQMAEKLALAGNLKAAANIMRTGQRGLLLNALEHDEAGAEATRKDYQRKTDSAVALVEQLRKMPLGAGEKGELDAVESAIRQHAGCFRQVSDFCAAGKTDEAGKLYKDIGAPAGAAMELRASELMASVMGEMKDTAARGADAIREADWMAVATPVLWVVVLSFAMWVVHDIGRKLRLMARRLLEGFGQVEGAAGRLSQSSQSLAQGAAEQSTSLAETSPVMEQAVAATQSNAENARAASAVMATVDERVREGNRTLDQMTACMAGITASGAKISRIIRVIDELAFQTNILALNAAVEAARAGEAGLGFAVVAGEVRNLAQRSAQAARDTGELIESSISQSGQGAGRLQEVARAIHAVTQSAAQARQLIGQVDLTSGEQTQRIGRISDAARQIERVTQQSSALSEQNAATSRELAAQAVAMRSIVEELEVLVGR